jgi:hypothetical protein
MPSHVAAPKLPQIFSPLEVRRISLVYFLTRHHPRQIKFVFVLF